MRFPTVFVNHGGGPMPLLGRQPELVQNMKDIATNFLPKEEPKAIVVLSAHWESNPIKISSSPKPKMYFDYYGFPPQTYEYEYPAPGSPELADRIQDLLGSHNLKSELDPSRGFDHGVFIPLMIMYPQATIPVVCVSLDASLDAERNMKIGEALSPLRDEGVLIMGSGYSFHNMEAFFGPTQKTVEGSLAFNQWLKSTIMDTDSDYLEKLKDWDKAPGGRISHPREEHLLPLLMVAAAGGKEAKPTLIYDTTKEAQHDPLHGITNHAVTGYMFQ